ncbi:hypothetical protein Tco_0365462 [Tanacetum coccineum]
MKEPPIISTLPSEEHKEDIQLQVLSESPALSDAFILFSYTSSPPLKELPNLSTSSKYDEHKEDIQLQVLLKSSIGI